MNKKLNLMKINEKELKTVHGGGYMPCHCACSFDPDYEVNYAYTYAQDQYNDVLPPWDV